jgi:hypothetical protein
LRCLAPYTACEWQNDIASLFMAQSNILSMRSEQIFRNIASFTSGNFVLIPKEMLKANLMIYRWKIIALSKKRNK